MNHGIFSWRALTACGALLCPLALFGSAFSWGVTARAWALAFGALLVFVGLAKGIRLTAAGDFEESTPAMWAGSTDEGATHSDAHGLVGRTGPMVNVDGTPMLDDWIDVAGKVYGDAGTTFNNDSGADMWDGGTSGGFDSHHVGGND